MAVACPAADAVFASTCGRDTFIPVFLPWAASWRSPLVVRLNRAYPKFARLGGADLDTIAPAGLRVLKRFCHRAHWGFNRLSTARTGAASSPFSRHGSAINS